MDAKCKRDEASTDPYCDSLCLRAWQTIGELLQAPKLLNWLVS